MIKAHSRRATESIPRSRVSGAVDGRISAPEPARLSKSPPILTDAYIAQFSEKSADFAKSPEIYARDPPGATWCSIGASQPGISTVGHF